MAQQFFYDGQIRRFVSQFIRMVSNFQVEFGGHSLQRVPVYYGDASRQASMILRNNSESAMNAVPAMAVYISGLQYDQSRMQEPNFVSKLNLRQTSYDPVTGEYGTAQDSAYTVERLMPVPYKLTLKLDIWTSNTEQKLQLIEQMGVLFNPSMEIQSTDNYIDWTSLTVVNRTDINWTSRSIPAGGEEPIDVCTMTFDIPIWISSPAKVKQLGVVKKVINSIFDANGGLATGDMFDVEAARTMFTPLDYGVMFVGNTLQLIKKHEIFVAANGGKIGTPDNWATLIGVYGSLVDGVSQVRLQLLATYDEYVGATDRTEVVGTVAFHPTDPTILLFTVDEDTLPANTLDPVNAIINPHTVNVDNNDLLSPSAGTRYLIVDNIDVSTVVWGDLVANKNDIIEFDGTNWVVSLDMTTHDQLEYVTNLNTGVQYKWQDGQWTKAVEGVYREGEWSIIL
jgi:hypothetical protein